MTDNDGLVLSIILTILMIVQLYWIACSFAQLLLEVGKLNGPSKTFQRAVEFVVDIVLLLFLVVISFTV